ncbi:MAG: integrase core domain-containing protein [Rhodanobacter sp.]
MRSGKRPARHRDVAQSRAQPNATDGQFTQCGCTAPNAYIERFNGTFRAEMPDAHPLESFDQARAVTEQWIPVYGE